MFSKCDDEDEGGKNLHLECLFIFFLFMALLSKEQDGGGMDSESTLHCGKLVGWGATSELLQ